MTNHTSPLDGIRVAAPCPADWERMRGDNQKRFCDQCNLNVYNLSGMTRREAEALITKNEGRLCVRFYRRADGTILTDNCPVGLRALRRRVSRTANAIISTVIGFFAGFGVNLMFGDVDGGRLPRHTVGEMRVVEGLRPPPIQRNEIVPVTGMVAAPLPPTTEPLVQGRMAPVEVRNTKQRRAGN